MQDNWTEIRNGVIASNASFTQEVEPKSVNAGRFLNPRGRIRLVGSQILKPAWEGSGRYPVQDHSTPLEIRSSQVNTTLSEVVGKRKFTKIYRISEFIRNSEWDQPCQNMFTYLVNRDPLLLMDIIKYWDLSNTQLSYAAETLGHYDSVEDVLYALLPLLNHREVLVREGVVYGLARHMNDDRIRSLLVNHMKIETSPGVRSAIDEALESETGC